MIAGAPVTARAMAAAVQHGEDPGRFARAAVVRARDNPYNAFRHVDLAFVDRQVESVNRDGPLAGVPLVVKDNLADGGEPCGCASRMLEGYRAPYTATAIARLRAAGAIVIGRTNMDEFGMGSSTEHSAYGSVRHPSDERRTPGGSSGGSAAAVAARIAPIGLGSDTGGSVRQPASFCGVVGMKPSQGRVSRHGLVAFASSCDCVGPFGVDVRDAALVTQLMSGADPYDSTCVDTGVPDLVSACDRGVRGLRIGVLAECSGAGLDSSVRFAVTAALQALRGAGAVLVPVVLPSLAWALACYSILTSAEASSNLARFDGIRFGPRDVVGSVRGVVTATRTGRLGEEVKRRIVLGTFALSAGYAERYYERAQAVRARIARDMADALTGVDLLFSPTSPTVAFPLGVRSADPLAMYLSDILTVPASLAGLPSISVPIHCGHGLPVGGQLTGRFLDESTVFAGAAGLEAALS